MDYTGFAVGGVAIIPLIIGIVEFAKKFGLEGNACAALSAGLAGLFIGLAYAVEAGMIPPIAVSWLNLVFVALGGAVTVGIGSSGLYDLSKKYFGNSK